MPIETKHPQWEANIYAWQKSRDTMGGEKIIKSKNTKYLDIPTGMLELTQGPSVGGVGTEQVHNITESKTLLGDDRAYDPTWHSNPAYRAYLRRAKFPDLPAFTVRGLIGLATKKDCDYELPAPLAYLEDKFTADGKSLKEFYKYAISEVLQTGRLPCVVDIRDGNFTVVYYSAESCTNWKEDGYFVFEECVDAGDDPFSHKTKIKYRIFFIDPESGIYMSSLMEEGDSDFVIPDESANFFGKPLKRLPVVVIGSTDNDTDADQIPIEGISDCAIQIYRKSADLSNAQYMSCNPTLVGIGVSEDDKPASLGSTVVWLIGNEAAKVDYPKTDTSALTHVKADINDLFEEAANYGAQLLGSPKKGAESAESIRLQQSAGGATLASVVDTVSAGIVSLVEIMMEWAGYSGEVKFEGSKEFTDMTLSSAEMKELRESWMSGGISQETYLFNLKRAGRLPDDRSVEDELELISYGFNDTLPDEKDLRLVVDNTEQEYAEVE